MQRAVCRQPCDAVTAAAYEVRISVPPARRESTPRLVSAEMLGSTLRCAVLPYIRYMPALGSIGPSRPLRYGLRATRGVGSPGRSTSTDHSCRCGLRRDRTVSARVL